MYRALYLSPIILFFITHLQWVVAADFAILSMNQSAPQLSNSQVRMIFSGKMSHISAIGQVQLLDWPQGSANRSNFYQLVLNKSVSQVNRKWAELAFSGKGQAPQELKLESIDELIKWLTDHPTGLSYLPANLVPEYANVVYLVREK